MKTTEIVCDTCGVDLAITDNCVGYRIVVDVESISSSGGVVTAKHVEPPLYRSYHFCALACLKRHFATE